MAPEPELTQLQHQWKELYTTILPSLPRVRDPAQPHWPVQLDHCFARIILDNTIGEGKQPWDQIIRKPAIRNMSDDQLRNAIELGQQIQRGEVNLVELDERSLAARGKHSKDGSTKANVPSFKREEGQFVSKKRKSGTATLQDAVAKKAKKQATLSFGQKGSNSQTLSLSSSEKDQRSTESLMPTFQRIRSHPTLTPYRRRLYAALLTVPEGRYTTYAAMSDYLGSSARAVGNSMRNNPFAPDVPCHRVLAADGSLGGFKGSWGEDGTYATEKVALLKKEGVSFDSRGKVKGEVWKGFYEIDGL